MTRTVFGISNKLAAAVVVGLVAALLPLAGVAPAQAAPVSFASTAVNQAGGACMDVPGGAATNALQLI
ncbi:MAG TPA: hypothetical protein VFE14_19735, partial [Micromonosporaceae bacterium]|nr:hypothetical protein [Micromonosporaceae bacterium]